jgi:hypothetical protein
MLGSPTFDTATLALASACIYDADNEIRKRLSKTYDFTAAPFLTTTTYPPMIVSLCETLALGYLYENMARGGKESYARADRYIKRAFENLNMLANGEAQLMSAAGVLVEESDGNWGIQVTEAYSNTFNEDDPHTWSVSSTKLDDIETSRDD